MKIYKEADTITATDLENDPPVLRHMALCILMVHIREGISSIRVCGHPE